MNKMHWQALAIVGLSMAPWTLIADGVPEAMKGTAPLQRGYVCYRTAAPIVIDGKLNDAAWSAVLWSEPFEDIEGGKQPKPRHRTRMKMLWDDEALYIAAELEEPHVCASITKHDDVIFRDNDFEVFLDPDGDNHLYAELELNALNTTWDLLLPKPYKDGGKALNGWEIIGMQTAVAVDGTLNESRDTDRGWTVEIRWPFAGIKELTSVAVPPRDGDQWRINFSRVEWDISVVDGKYRKVPNRPEHNWVWSPQGVIDMHRPERWGYLQFSTAKPGTARIRTDPTAPARDMLHRVYYAQHEHRKAHGRFATTIAELGLPGLGTTSPIIETTRSSFEVSTPVSAGGDNKSKRLTINQDSRIDLQ